MRYHDPLHDRFEELKGDRTDRQGRGREFESVVAELFDRAGYDVVVNPGAAKPRQTDLHASRRDEAYLIEVKWREADIGSPDVDDMRMRLTRQPSNVIGVIVTMAGVADSAVREVEQHRATPVLIVGRQEIEDLVLGRLDLKRLLRDKRIHLTVHGRVTGSPTKPFAASVRDRTEPLRICDAEGKCSPWLSGPGDYESTIWSLELADIDWVTAGGTGVTLDLPVEVDSLSEVRNVCEELAALGWLTHGAAWAIEQGGTTWSGFGLESFLVALAARDARYAPMERIHHREVVQMTDECPGGWFTVEIDLDARSERAYRLDISIQLIGVPVDPSGILRLCDRLDVSAPGYFRPRDERSVESLRLPEPIEVTPTAWIVEHEPGLEDDPLWVRGIAFANPLEELPIHLPRDVLIIASLRSWHPVGQTPSAYLLDRLEWTRSSDSTVVRATVDWPHDPAVVDTPPRRAAHT
ncbi:MAG: hypothetical protein JWQ18_56 [Conexibacter sp.]|nr:hypothetical protein [Conexibacter sp.]